MRFNKLAAGLILVAAAVWGPVIQDRAMAAGPVEKKHTADMGWRKKARFGMFIHCGLYAIPDPMASVVVLEIHGAVQPKAFQGC
ncbi:MAG: hypothetical protein M1472_05825 [Planctomycetes bacterium]|nr:hypothetical protein [Planctomycetota bacterium]